MFKKIVDFHKDLINVNSPSSSRRFLAIMFSYSILLISFLVLIFKLTIPEFIFISLCTMTLVFLGLASWSNNINLKNKNNLSSEKNLENLNKEINNE